MRIGTKFMAGDARDALHIEDSAGGDPSPLRDSLGGNPEMTRKRNGAVDGFKSLGESRIVHGSNNKHGFQRNASDTFIANKRARLKVFPMENDVGRALRLARKALKKPMAEVADAVGVSTAAVQQWETNVTRPSPDNLAAAARFLGLDEREMLAKLAKLEGTSPNPATPRPSHAEPSPQPNAIIETEEPRLPDRGGARDIEELGIVVGGDGEDDGAFAFNGQVIDRVTRPPGIMHRTDVFALRVFNTSMVPKYEDGERIFAERRRPAIGEYVVLELHPTQDGAGKGFIKRLVSQNSGRVVVEQFNPPKQLEFARDTIKALNRVIPWHELLGI